ncbi:MAG: hypothetical protein GY679_01005 [Mycoplasma sp.]|nr:hypothetical protein [Mycoplasma sp.]
MKSAQKNEFVDNISNIKPAMLPPMFRKRVRFKQRLSLALIIIFIAIALGMMLIAIMGDLADKYDIKTPKQKEFFLYSMLSITITLFTSMGFVVWSRTKAFVILFHELLLYILSPLITIIGFIIILSIQSSDSSSLLVFLSYLNLSIGSITSLTTLSVNSFKKKKYNGSYKRTLATFFPLIIISLSSIILSLSLKNNGGTNTESLKPLLYMFITMISGIILFLIGCALTNRYVIIGTKTLWNSIRFSGGLNTLLIYTTLLSISIKFSIGAPVMLPLTITIIADLALLILFSTYAFFSGRMNNIFKTNPLFNQVVLKIFIVFVSLLGLIMVKSLPNMYDAPSYGGISYAILLMTSLTIIIGVIIAHFANLLVYSKYFKSVIIGTIITIIIILSIIFTIGALKHTSLIINIMGPNLVITFLMITILIESILSFTDIAYITINLIKTNSNNKKTSIIKKKEGK